VRVLRIPRGNFNAVAYSADGRFLLATHSGRRLRVWATADLSERYAAQLPGPLYPHRDLAVTGDLAVVTRAVFSLTALYEALGRTTGPVREKGLVREVRLEKQPLFAFLAASPDGRTIACYARKATDAAQAVVWDEQRRPVGSAILAFDTVAPPAISPDDRTLALCTRSLVVLVDRKGFRGVAQLRHTDIVDRAVFSPDGRWLATSAGRSVWLWDVAGRTGERFPAFQKHVRGLAFHPEGKLLAAGDRVGEIRLWEPSSQRQQGSLNFGVGAVHGLAFSPDGMTVAAAGHDNAVVVWDLE
jgi:WD40 repeat protein